MGAENAPDLSDVVRAAIASKLKDVHTTCPAKITAYDAAKQLATCQPLIQVPIPQEGASPTDPPVYASLPPITNVPVIFPGAGGYRITFPVKIGDTMVLLFSESSIDDWLSGDGSVTTPKDPHRFNLSDGIGALPGLHPINKAWQSMPTDHATFGQDAGPLFRAFSDHLALGGAAPVDYVALASLVKAALTTLKTAISSAATVPMDGGASFKAAIVLSLASWPPDVKSAKVKSD